MITTLSRRVLLLTALLLGVASCDRQPPPPLAEAASPPAEATTPVQPLPSAPDNPGITFGEGFHKQEATPTAVLRWVRRDAALRMEVPAAGRYRLTFRPFTVYTNVENSIEVSVGEQSAGRFSARAFDLAHPVPVSVEAELRAGGNDLRLHSTGAETRLSPDDERQAAFGLVLPITVEKIP